MRCIICGKENNDYICEACSDIVDIEAICRELILFRPEESSNVLWEEIAAELENPYDIRGYAYELADKLKTPRKQYVKILSLANNSYNIRKDDRSELYSLAETCGDSEKLESGEKGLVKGFVLDALFKDYLYEDADELAAEMMKLSDLPGEAYSAMAEFYTKTRRYETADRVIADAKAVLRGNERAEKMILKRENENKVQKEKKENGKKEYLPTPREGREEIQQRYIAFLNSVGVEAELPMPSMEKLRGAPSPIKKERYPEPIFTFDPDFDSFVAFDLETTGLSSKYNSIIEIGAIKVINGEVIETQEFIFQEFVKPFRSTLTEEVEKLTGITLPDLMFARQMWEVFPDFMDFAGDNILLGYNCNAFDSRFMTRAGRYSHIEIRNPYFDVMRYARRFKRELDIESKGMTLTAVSETLGITNPEAHRALADAITTAKVFLKLRNL